MTSFLRFKEPEISHFDRHGAKNEQHPTSFDSGSTVQRIVDT